MQKVLARFVTAQWGTQVHSLLGKFKPCPFESRQINLYEENNKKCHHFKEIRERIVRACGKHCCSKHRQQWEKEVQQLTWKDEWILRWTTMEKPKHPTRRDMGEIKADKPKEIRGWRHLTWPKNRKKGTPCAIHHHICAAMKSRQLQQTAKLWPAWRRKPSSALPKTGHCQELDPGSDGRRGNTCCAHSLFPARPDFSNATLKNTFSSICHSKWGMK